MADLRLELIEHIRSRFYLLDRDKNPNLPVDNARDFPYEIGVSVDVWDRPVTPVALEDDNNLPAIFFGYGPNRPNNNLVVGTGFKGETLSLIINAVVGQATIKNYVVQDVLLNNNILIPFFAGFGHFTFEPFEIVNGMRTAVVVDGSMIDIQGINERGAPANEVLMWDINSPTALTTSHSYREINMALPTGFSTETVNVSVDVEEDLIIRSAKMQRTVELIANSISTPTTETFNNAVVVESRIASTEPFTQGMSDREFLRHTLEVDWYYESLTP